MMNDAARDIFGLTPGDIGLGDPLSRFLPQEFHDKHTSYVDSFRQSAVKTRPMQPWSSVYGIRADGSKVPIEVTISKMVVGNKIEMTAIIRDISERTRLIERLEETATRDPLTGIFNRRQGISVLNNEMQRCQRFGHTLTIASLELDHFNVVTDAYGNDTGDLILTSVVKIISSTLRGSDTFCRWGGEEFLVILPETVLDDALRWAQRAREAVAFEEIDCLRGKLVNISASIGLTSVSKQESKTLDELLKCADEALYQARNGGRNQVSAAIAVN